MTGLIPVERFVDRGQLQRRVDKEIPFADWSLKYVLKALAIKYRKVCGLIKTLLEFGGVAESEHLVTELKEKHPRRPAMLEELDSLEARLAKKGK